MQSLSQATIEGKNQEKMSTMSSRTSSQRLVNRLFADLRVSFQVISYSMAAKYVYAIPKDYNVLILINQLRKQKQNKMKHKYSKSTNVLPRSTTRISQLSTQDNKDSVTRLPEINLRRSSNASLLSSKNQTTKRVKKEPELDPAQIQIINSVRERARLLALLKEKILECSDNVFLKKLLSEIKFTSIGKVGLEMWYNVQSFQNCDQKLMDEIEQKYQLKITEDSLKTMDFINNVCRFMLADYKKKRWLTHQKKVNDKFLQINKGMSNVGKRIQDIENPHTKMQILLSLAGIKQECFAKKQCYVNWKERAVQKLKQNQIKCQILRAQIFTEGFF